MGSIAWEKNKFRAGRNRVFDLFCGGEKSRGEKQVGTTQKNEKRNTSAMKSGRVNGPGGGWYGAQSKAKKTRIKERGQKRRGRTFCGRANRGQLANEHRGGSGSPGNRERKGK